MSADYGYDVSTFPDLDPMFTLVTGPRVVAEAVMRRFMTPRGGLVDAPDYGLDLRARINGKLMPGDIARLQADLEAEAEKDERVLSATATVTAVPSTMSMRVSVQLETAAGPFTLVMLASSATIQNITPG